MKSKNIEEDKKKENGKKKTTTTLIDAKFTAKILPERLKKVVDIMSVLVYEIKMKIHEKGIQMIAIDAAHVAMVTLELEAGGFEEYTVHDKTEINVDLAKLKEVLKLAQGEDPITMQIDKNTLIMQIGHVTRKIRLNEKLEDAPKVPNLNLDTTIQMKSDDIKLAIKATGDVTDHIQIIALPDGIILRGEGDTDEIDLELAKNQLEELKCTEKACGRYPLDYMTKIARTIDLNEIVKITMGNDYPCKIGFQFADGNGKAEFLVAPRIESE